MLHKKKSTPIAEENKVNSIEDLFQRLETENLDLLDICDKTFEGCTTFDLIYLTRHYPDFLISLFPQFKSLNSAIDFPYLLFIAKYCNDEFIQQVNTLPICATRIKSAEKLLQIAALNPRMALDLLGYDIVLEVAKDVVHLLPFEDLLHHVNLKDPHTKNQLLKKIEYLDLATDQRANLPIIKSKTANSLSSVRFFQCNHSMKELDCFREYKKEIPHVMNYIKTLTSEEDKPDSTPEAIGELNRLHPGLGDLFADHENFLFEIKIDSVNNAKIFFDIISEEGQADLDKSSSEELNARLKKHADWWGDTPRDDQILMMANSIHLGLLKKYIFRVKM